MFEVLLGWRRGAPEDWIRFVKNRVEGLDLSPLSIFNREDRTVPNFLLPIPPRAMSTLDDELKSLCATPSERIRSDLRAEFGGDVPKEFQQYQVDPEAALAAFAAAVGTYWDAVFRPVWPRMRAVLDREVVVCGKVLATEGPVAALARVHPEFKVKDGSVCFDSVVPGHVATHVGRRSIALIPVVAGPAVYLSSLDRPDEVVLSYAAPGSSAVWHSHADAPTESALVRLLGETRARMSALLAEPMSTTMLAKHLGLAPATVSEHLSALAGQGIVDSTRVGRTVYYELNARGRSTMDLFSA